VTIKPPINAAEFKKKFRLPDHMCHDIDGMLGAGLPASMNTRKTQIHMWHFNVPKLKKFLTFSVNDRY
jgi:hypothetical protein